MTEGTGPDTGKRGDTPFGFLRTSWARLSPRERWGWTVSALGLAVILGAVLHLTSATIGGPIHDFKDRRTYSEVKTEAHRVFPLTFCLGIAGIGLVWLGGRMRDSSRKSGPDA